MKIHMTKAARANVEEVGSRPILDVQHLRKGIITREELLAECLNGADVDRVQGWHDYVEAVARVAAALGPIAAALKPVTVVGWYPTDGAGFVRHVMAVDAGGAEGIMRATAAIDSGAAPHHNRLAIHVAAVFAGHLEMETEK